MLRSGIVATILWVALLWTGPGFGQIPGDKTGLPSKQAGDQINAVLVRCPQLQKIVVPGNAIWTWLAKAFDTSGLGYTIVFDAQPVSVGPVSAESGPLNGSSDTFCVRVDPKYTDGPQAGQERTAEEVLCRLVFELHNVRMFRDHEIIDHLANCGEMDRESYIYNCAHEEYSAFQQTADFYYKVWAPFCATSDIKANPEVWRLPMEATFGAWLARYPKSSWYPWKLFGGRYDQENDGSAHPVPLHGLSAEEMNDLMKKAAAGDVRAQERVGVAFLSGEKGVRGKNDQEAFDWMLKAADQGDVLAEKHLEWMYRLGIGVEKDQAKGFPWNLKAANQGDAQAEYLLGARYETGAGVAKDPVEAARWYQKSADQGYGEAEDQYAYALLEGTGVEKDPPKALSYLEKAAHGNAHASYVLADCYANGFYVKKDLTEAYKWCLISLTMDWQANSLSRQLKAQLSDAQIKQAEAESAPVNPPSAKSPAP